MKVVAEHLTKAFGGVKAVDDVSITMEDGEILGLVGGNGAGKTTMFNLITGFTKPDHGAVRIAGSQGARTVTGKKISRLARLGLARTFQNIRLFESLTVLENAAVAALACGRDQAFARAMLDRVGLATKENWQSSSLPYGERRKLELARALSTGAATLFLDEPVAGMTQTETNELMHLILSLKQELSLTIMLIEHNMQFIAGICGRVGVMDEGKLIAFGDTKAVLQDRDVGRVLLGE